MVVDQLKDILTALNDRVSVLEHSVNDTLIAGLKKASDDYKDSEDYKAFSDKYGKSIADVEPFLKCINGDDYDCVRNMFNAIKTVDGYGKEGFDSDSLMSAKLEELKEKMHKLAEMKALNNGTATTTQADVIAVESGDDEGKEKEKESEKDSDDKAENTIKEDDEQKIPSEEELAEELRKALLNN